jgi:hypothetical protein
MDQQFYRTGVTFPTSVPTGVVNGPGRRLAVERRDRV